jgi:hypothetical protein
MIYRFCLLLCVLCASARVSLAQVIPLRWDVETSRPPSYGITLYRGESLNLEPRFLSYSEPLDLSDILSVEFRYRSADMAAETYYRIVGALHPSNAGRVRIPWVPTNETAQSSFTYGVWVTTSTGEINRCYGTLKLRGTIQGANTNTPEIVHGVVDWSLVDNLNLSSAPFVTIVSWTATNAALQAQIDLLSPASITDLSQRVAQVEIDLAAIPTNGVPGPQGPAGNNGVDGAVGPQGPAGADGADGTNGAPGAAGTNGTNGAPGAAGSNGVAGATGPAGPAGSNANVRVVAGTGGVTVTPATNGLVVTYTVSDDDAGGVTAAQVSATGTYSTVQAAINGLSRKAPTTISYTSTNLTTDASLNQTFRVTLTNDVTMAKPTNMTDGQSLRWWIKQGTGTNEVSLNSAFVLPSGTTNLVLSTAVNAVDILVGEYDAGADKVRLTGLLKFSQ